MSYILDIDSQISLQGNISDFEIQVIKNKLPSSTKIGSAIDASPHIKSKNISSLKKAKINKLKERIQQIQKAQQFMKCKFDHFITFLETKSDQLKANNDVLKIEIQKVKKQKIQQKEDLQKITKYLKNMKQQKIKKGSPKKQSSIQYLKKQRIHSVKSNTQLAFTQIVKNKGLPCQQQSPLKHKKHRSISPRVNTQKNQLSQCSSQKNLKIKKKKPFI